MYDLMLEADACSMPLLPLFNYSDVNHDATHDS